MKFIRRVPFADYGEIRVKLNDNITSTLQRIPGRIAP